MGFSTVIVVNNDLLDKAPPEVQRAVRSFPAVRNPSDADFHWGRVIAMAHSSYAQLVMAKYGGGSHVNADGLEVPPDVLFSMQLALERHGFRVIKPRKKKPAALSLPGDQTP